MSIVNCSPNYTELVWFQMRIVKCSHIFTDLVEFEQLLRGVRQLAEGERRVEVDLPAQRGHDLLPVVAIGEDTAGWNQTVDRVGNSPDQDPDRKRRNLDQFKIQI